MKAKPSTWKRVPLAEITDINREQRNPTGDDYFKYIDIESVENGSGIIRGARLVQGEMAPSRARRVVHTNDIIMSTVRPYLKAFAIIPAEHNGAICSTGFAVISVRESILPDYLLYSLFSNDVIAQCNRMMVGGQYPALTSTQVAKIEINLPSLPEQRKIVEPLRAIDEAIRKTDEAIAHTERLQQGLLRELMTRGINGKKTVMSEIGQVPPIWQIVSLHEILELCQYGLSQKMVEKGGYPIVKMDDINHNKVSAANVRYVNIDSATFEKYQLKKGDIVFNRTNSIEHVGRTGLFDLDGKYVFASYLIRLRFERSKVLPDFMNYYMVYAKGRIRKLATRSVHQANINATNLNKLRIPLPTLREQEEIASILDAVDSKLGNARKRGESLGWIKSLLLSDFVTGKVRHRDFA